MSIQKGAPHEFSSSVTAEKAPMRAKMGNEFPKMGNSLPVSSLEAPEVSYGAMVAAAVRRELGGSHQAIKTLMRRTGVSSRTAKNWLAGAAGPTGAHLVELMRSSDLVFEAVLKMAGREQALTSHRLAEARELVRRAEVLLGDMTSQSRASNSISD